MTKLELEMAQFLHNIAIRAETLADKVDPNRDENRCWEAMQLDAIRSKAQYTFYLIVGRQARKVSSEELNTDSPAPWTRAKKDNEGRR